MEDLTTTVENVGGLAKLLSEYGPYVIMGAIFILAFVAILGVFLKMNNQMLASVMKQIDSKNEESKELTKTLLNKVIYGMAMGHRRKLDFSKYSFLQKLQVALLAGLGSSIDMKTLIKWERKAALRQTKGKSRLLYYSNYQPDYVHMIIPKEGSKKVLEVPFEGLTVMIPKGYDKVLKVVYGDYMALPPEEKRKPTHGELEAEGFFVNPVLERKT